MSKAYREYLELYSYFGRGGLVRLDRATFESLSAELASLVALAPNLDVSQVRRVIELKRLLIRDLPRIEKLLARRER